MCCVYTHVGCHPCIDLARWPIRVAIVENLVGVVCFVGGVGGRGVAERAHLARTGSSLPPLAMPPQSLNRGAPTVRSVGFYRDARLLPPGETTSSGKRLSRELQVWMPPVGLNS